MDMVEADAMDDSDENIEDQEYQNLRQEDAYDYGGFAVDVGGAEPQAQNEWDPIRFY